MPQSERSLTTLEVGTHRARIAYQLSLLKLSFGDIGRIMKISKEQARTYVAKGKRQGSWNSMTATDAESCRLREQGIQILIDASKREHSGKSEP